MDKFRELFKSKKFILLFSMFLSLISIIIFRISFPSQDILFEFIILPILSLIWGPIAILGFISIEFLYLTIVNPANIASYLLIAILIFVGNFAIWKLWYSIMNEYWEIPNLRNSYNLIKLFTIFLTYALITYFLFDFFINDWDITISLILTLSFGYFTTIFLLYVLNYFKMPIYTPKKQIKKILPKKIYSVLFILFILIAILHNLEFLHDYSILLGVISLILIIVYLLNPYPLDINEIKTNIVINLFNKIITSLFLILATLIFILMFFILFYYVNSTHVFDLDLIIFVIDILFRFILLIMIPILIYTYILEKKVTKPINELSKLLSNEINTRKEYLTHKNSLESIDTNNEIKILINSLLDMEDTLISYEENLVQITSEKERYETELKLAYDIQHSMIPRDFEEFYTNFNNNIPGLNEITKNDFELWGIMQPAREVGGDFYDYFKIDEDNLGFVIGDVSGKGIPAALIMVKAMTLIQNYTKQYDDLSKVFYEVNNQLSEDNVEELFVTCWLGKLNINNGQLSFVNAGHNQPLIRLNNTNTDFEYMNIRPGLVLAAMDDMSYKTHTIQLNKEDTIFLYTDGVTEANDNYNGFYGENRLKKVLNKHKNDDLNVIISSIEKDINDFCNHKEQFDDTTMLIIKIK